MALLIHWYDFLCFAIVVGAIFSSLWMLLQRKNIRKYNTKYESLLISRSEEEDEQYISVTRGPSSSHLLSSSQLWTSCWRDVNPVWLLVFRFFSFLVMAGILSLDVRQHGTVMFVYYTEYVLLLLLLLLLQFLGTIISAQGCWKNSKKPVEENEERDVCTEKKLEESRTTTAISFWANKVRATIKVQSYNHEQEEIEQRAGFVGYLMQTVYQTCAGAVILTDLVFWGLIVPFISIEHLKLNLIMGCMHTLNAVFLLLDTALNSLPFPWFRLAYFLLWSCIYVIFQWVLHACGFPWWPYPFLELSTPWAPLWYFCLALIHIPCYGFYALIVKLKNAAFSKWFPHAYVGLQ
ncbi:hypothetical protein BVC80_379g80 [Macleaya cordata]|uniref:Transmembrane protein n=1 Tax=Macleaya cordata TaxID=56857 RepID=A0A200QSV4_MACCD|nr:hypothetical protein BVC80_379g80 [Macleaya cordata]